MIKRTEAIDINITISTITNSVIFPKIPARIISTKYVKGFR